jgi:hypothetical protein
LVISINLFSQNESFLGLSFGAAFPQGPFAEKNYDDDQSGYANTGFLFTFDGAIFPDDYLGIGATISYGSNNPDKSQFQDDLKQMCWNGIRHWIIRTMTCFMTSVYGVI